MKIDFWKLLTLVVYTICFSYSGTAQLIKHSYRFYNTLSVSLPECGPDLIQAEAPGRCGGAGSPGSFITDTLSHCGLKRTVYQNNQHWGLQYPNTQGTITNTYTIQLYVKNLRWGDTWTRIIDFSNGFSDAGIYFKASGSSPNRCLDFYPSGIIGACPYFNDSTYYLLTITRNGNTGFIDVYVNNVLFTSYNDASGTYVGTAGTPIYIYRDDREVSCESGEAYFAYLSFTNQYSTQASVDAVYQDICSIVNTGASAEFSFMPVSACDLSQNITVTYTGNIASPGPGYTFHWNWDGGTVVAGSGMGPFTINWETPGLKNITLTITENACGSSNTRTQSFLVEPHLSSAINQSICEGETYLGYSATGIYRDTLMSVDGCDSVRTLTLTVLNKPIADLGPDKELCEGDTLQVTPGSSFSSYLWQDGSTVSYFTVHQAGSYSVTVTNGCGSAKDEINITERTCNLYFPTAFSPNGDGKNDLFKALNAPTLQNYTLVIYNRWGQKIFQTQSHTEGWDGTFKRQLQHPGAYVWFCKFIRNNVSVTMKGTLILMR